MNDIDFNLLTSNSNTDNSNTAPGNININTTNSNISVDPSSTTVVSANVDTDSSNSIASPFGLVHHQVKLDVFIIRAYNLLSNGAIINCSHLTNAATSPQTAMNSPSIMMTNPGIGSAKTVSSGETLLKNNDLNDPSNTNNNNISDTPDSSSTYSNNTSSYSYYIQLFSKISNLYMATLTSGSSVDEKSNSPKSAIELFQRFVQIIKELELSFEISPYSKYFHRLDENLWQIKSDTELENDVLWKTISTNIFTIYEPQTGKMLNQKNNSNGSGNNNTNNINKNTTNNNNNNTNNKSNKNSSSSNTPRDQITTAMNVTPVSNNSTDSKNDNSMNGNANEGDNLYNNTTDNKTNSKTKKPKKKYTRKKAVTANGSTKTTTKKGNTKANAKNSNSNNNNNGDDNNTGNENVNINTNPNMNMNMNMNMNENPSGMETTMSQILQKKLQSISVNRDETGGLNNRNNTTTNNNNNLSKAINGYYTQPTSPGRNFQGSGTTSAPSFDFNLVPNDGNANMNNNNNNNSNNTNNEMHMNSMNGNPSLGHIWKRRSLGSIDINTLDDDAVEELLQLTSNNGNSNNNSVNSGGNINTNNNSNNSNSNSMSMPMNMNMSNMGMNMNMNKRPRVEYINNQQVYSPNAALDAITRQLKQTYDQVVNEKDQRIIQLERELEVQRNETQWLRKMLIEDMGCVRSMLQDINQ